MKENNVSPPEGGDTLFSLNLQFAIYRLSVRYFTRVGFTSLP